jgi:hypothetical protein
MHDIRHRVSSRLLSLGRGGGAKPRGYRNEDRCRLGGYRTRISRFGGGLMLVAVGAKSQVVQESCGCDGLRMPRFPGNPCRTDNIRKIQEQSVIAKAPGEVFNVPTVRSHRDAIYIKVSAVVD